ncbi:hypothetical protein F443_01975 [Phytophthora nicotianae P1569]|uniref:Uncharacterized protein n=2 Tax=Phytophthora nicotianae TaxID=4792 RepID=V9FY83_PHYNI|nr:hypothetical protein F443_01975 [Phytophthora nicotianae P1569]ETO84097.1 hypothetical protein F444_01974 [Phytophthora nicotianae P1976]
MEFICLSTAPFAVQGVAWVKAKIKTRLDAKDLPYSRNKWKQFGVISREHVIEVFQDDASSGLSDDELGILYNTSLDYEEEEKCE